MTQAATEGTGSGEVWAADLGHAVRTDVTPREAFAGLVDAVGTPAFIEARVQHGPHSNAIATYVWGEAHAGETPGLALHRALCRWARVRPTAPGAYAGAADLLGLTRAAYNRVVHHGTLGRVVALAQQVGLSVLSRGGATVVGP